MNIDYMNISLQLENFGMNITTCRVNDVSAYLDFQNGSTLTVKICNEDDTQTIEVLLDYRIKFYSETYHNEAFIMNYAISLYHIKYHISTFTSIKEGYG